MGYPAVTYSFSNSTTSDATQVNQNFSDIINGLSDGTKYLNVNRVYSTYVGFDALTIISLPTALPSTNGLPLTATAAGVASWGLLKKPVASKTTNYTATVLDEVIICDTSGGGWTLTLPAASGNTGLTYYVKKISGDLSVLTIDGNGSETIDGSTTKTITTQYDSLTIVCDGSGWYVI